MKQFVSIIAIILASLIFAPFNMAQTKEGIVQTSFFGVSFGDSKDVVKKTLEQTGHTVWTSAQRLDTPGLDAFIIEDASFAGLSWKYVAFGFEYDTFVKFGVANNYEDNNLANEHFDGLYYALKRKYPDLQLLNDSDKDGFFYEDTTSNKIELFKKEVKQELGDSSYLIMLKYYFFAGASSLLQKSINEI